MSKRTHEVELPHLLIRASAGSGKTFRLTNRYLELAYRGVPLERILATTFTRKAAGEILARVLTRLAAAADRDDERERLSDWIAPGKLSRTACLELLRRLACHIHRLRIGTLDSLFGQMARAFALELDLPPGWSIADDAEDAEMRSDAVSELLAAHETGDVTRIVHLLSKGSHEQSVVRLIHNTVQDLYGLFQETTAEAWKQLPFRKTLDERALEVAFAGLDAAPLPSDKRAVTARDKDRAAAASGQWETFLSKGLTAKILSGEPTYYGKDLSDDLIAAYVPLIEHASALIVNRFAAQTEGTYELLERFDSHYRRLQQSRRRLRFEDITRRLGRWTSTMARTAAGQSYELSLLAFRLDARIDHLLLDEFQDTSLAQWQVLQPIARKVTVSAEVRTKGDVSVPTSFFCVGDPKQAIYAWRGGLAEIFEALEQQLEGIQPETLAESRRSSPAVIETVNRVFREAPQRLKIDRGGQALVKWCAAFPLHTTALTEMPGYVTLETPPAPPADEQDDEPADGAKRTGARAEGESDGVVVPEADRFCSYAAQRIQQIVREAPGRKIGVLMRSNAGIARMIHELRKLDVPASEEGGNPPTDSAAVQLVVSALQLADHPGDSIARFHLAHSPLGPEFGLHSAYDVSGQMASEQIRRAVAQQGYGAVLERWSNVLADHVSPRDRRRLEQVTELAYRRQSQATLRPSDFVRLLESTRMPDASHVDVRVTTIHQSKGLEYDIVVLPELKALLCGQPDQIVTSRSETAGPIDTVCRYVSTSLRTLLPLQFQELFEAQEDADVVESLCVLYVALTRAIHALHLIVPASSPSEKKIPGTFGGLLRAALTDGAPLPHGAVIYEHGDPQWARGAAEQKRSTDALASGGRQPADSGHSGEMSAGQRTDARRAPGQITPGIRLAALTGPRRRGLERVAPSLLEGGPKRRLADALVATPKRGKQRGTLMHAWCECVGWLDDARPGDDELWRVARQSQEIAWTDAELRQLTAELLESLDRPNIRHRLERTAYIRPADTDWSAEIVSEIVRAGQPRIELFREWRFAVRRDDELVVGSLDRLVLIYEGARLIAADILDYKTDAVPVGDEAALAARVDFYRPQVDAYRAAVAQALTLEPRRIAARLLFLGPGAVVTL